MEEWEAFGQKENGEIPEKSACIFEKSLVS